MSSFPEPRTTETSLSDPPVVCRPLFDELRVLASGEIVCPRYPGEGRGIRRVFGNVYRDRVADVFNGRVLRGLRRWQLKARAGPYCPARKDDCEGRAADASPADVDEIRTVKTLRLEPVSSCGAGSRASWIEQVRYPFRRPVRLAVLPLPVMLDVVGQLPALKTLVLESCGEPFLHGDVIPFLREVRRRRPDVAIQVGTSGSALDAVRCDTIAAEGLVDRIVFTIDGGREESYRRAGADGSFWGALRALEDLVAARKRHGAGGRIEIRWEYLLERGNDSAAETDVARRLAAGIGVPIDFVSPDFEGALRRCGDPLTDAAGTRGRRQATAARRSLGHAPWWWRLLGSSFRSGSALLPRP